MLHFAWSVITLFCSLNGTCLEPGDRSVLSWNRPCDRRIQECIHPSATDQQCPLRSCYILCFQVIIFYFSSWFWWSLCQTDPKFHGRLHCSIAPQKMQTIFCALCCIDAMSIIIIRPLFTADLFWNDFLICRATWGCWRICRSVSSALLPQSLLSPIKNKIYYRVQKSLACNHLDIPDASLILRHETSCGFSIFHY